MMRSQTRKALQGPNRDTSEGEDAHRPPRTMQRKAAGPAGSMGCASEERASTAKVVILTGSATLVAVLLMAFTVYAMVLKADEILKELLSFTQYLTVLVI